MMTITLVGMICMMSMMPGSSTTAILDTTWTHGRRLGFLTALGGSAGVAVYTLLALVVGTFVSGEGLWLSILEGVGAVYLAALGVMALIEAFASKAEDDQQTTKPCVCRVFLIGLLTTLVSPKTALFYLVILSQYDFQGASTVIGICLAGALHMVFRLGWYGFWIHLVAPARQALDGIWMQRGMKVVTGTLLMALSVHFVF